MASDSSLASVTFLLSGSGTNGGVSFTECSPNPKTITTNGNTQVSTAQSKYYGSSIYFDGTGDYLSLATTPDFGFGTAAFTFEAWIYIAGGQNTDRGITDFRASVSAEAGTFFIDGTTNKLAFWYGSKLGSTGTALTTSTWYHVALCRSGTAFTCYLNGTQDFTANATVDFGATKPLGIGGSVNASAPGSSPFNGYMNDIRITKGVARYTGTFTSPSALTGVLSGTVKDDANANASRTVYCYDRGTGVKTGSATSTSGVFSVRVPATDHMVVALDDDAGTTYNDLIYSRVAPV